MSRLRAATFVLVGAMSGGALLACGASVSPSGPAVSDLPRTVEIVIRIVKAPDQMLNFFAHNYLAQLTVPGRPPQRWRLGDGGGVQQVPGGAARLEVWSEVIGDTMECVPDPATAGESCFSPIIGEGQHCSIELRLEPETTVALLFQLLAEERCRLRPDPAAAEVPADD